MKLKCRLKIARIALATAFGRNAALWIPLVCLWCAFGIR